MQIQTFNLWNLGEAIVEDQTSSEYTPYLVAYIQEPLRGGNKRRPAILICPGGGYCFCSPREAEPIAMQYLARGYQAFVVYYSIAPSRFPAALKDAAKSMDIIRSNADMWCIDPKAIVICGFSAGGHLAASLGTMWDCAELKACGLSGGKVRPDAMILAYPVITARKGYAHEGSFAALLGTEAIQQEETRNAFSLETCVNEKTPPAFIWHTAEDTGVPPMNSLLFAEALDQHKVPYSLHIFPKGNHGLSLATTETAEGSQAAVRADVATWIEESDEWFQERRSL